MGGSGQRAEGSWDPAKVVVGITKKEALCVRNTLLTRTGPQWSISEQDGMQRHPRQHGVWQRESSWGKRESLV